MSLWSQQKTWNSSTTTKTINTLIAALIEKNIKIGKEDLHKLWIPFVQENINVTVSHLLTHSNSLIEMDYKLKNLCNEKTLKRFINHDYISTVIKNINDIEKKFYNEINYTNKLKMSTPLIKKKKKIKFVRKNKSLTKQTKFNNI